MSILHNHLAMPNIYNATTKTIERYRSNLLNHLSSWTEKMNAMSRNVYIFTRFTLKTWASRCSQTASKHPNSRGSGDHLGL